MVGPAAGPDPAAGPAGSGPAAGPVPGPAETLSQSPVWYAAGPVFLSEGFLGTVSL